MIKDSIIAIYFSVNSRAVCDYVIKLATKMAENNLVIALLIYADPYPLLKNLLLGKRQPVVYKDNGVYFCRPVYLLPFQRFALISRWNRCLFLHLVFPVIVTYIRYKQYKKPVGKKQFFFFYHPQKEKEYFQKVYKYFSKRGVTIYDIVDYPEARNIQERMYIEQYVKSADVVIVNSKTLYRHFSSVRRDIAVVPQGFSLEEFQYPRRVKTFLQDKPIIGFVGSIGSKLDFSLLYRLIDRNPQYRFIFWGPKEYVSGENRRLLSLKIVRLYSYPNVLIGKSKNKRDIPNVIKQFDICMIPYRTSVLAIQMSYPMKIMEYFYMGKPVISTPIEELRRFPKFIRVGSAVEKWEEHINELLSRSWPDSYRKKQRYLAMLNSWENKLKTVSFRLVSHQDTHNDLSSRLH